MVNAEKVVIDIIANDKATSILENVRGKLIELNNLSNKYNSSISSINQNISNNNSRISDNITGNVSSNNIKSPKIDSSSIDSAKSKVNEFGNAGQDATNKTKNGFDGLSKSVNETNKKIENNSKTLGTYSNYNYRSFDKVNTLLSSMSSEFDKIGTQIASIFGVAGFGGMIEKMWQGASERQTNMLFLIRQRGVDQANKYYDEIMNIVTQLPGDDTFLTNMLNTASALDNSIKLDNLKEMGKTITDFTIASTMKGERPFESQRDTRLYLNSGDTRSLRNSIISDELDMLENKNTILERTQALQKALDKKGLTGMSEYESASNELEELKGHFQKAFADIGTIVTGIGQPIMKFYNTLDTLFDSHISQGIILMATALIGLFSVLAGGSIMIMWITRSIQIFGELREIMMLTSKEVRRLGSLKAFLTGVTADLLGVEGMESTIRQGNVFAILSESYATLKLSIAKRLDLEITGEQTVSLWALTTASLNLVKSKIITIGITIRNILLKQDENIVLANQMVLEGKATARNLSSLQVERAKAVLLGNNIRNKIRDTIVTTKSSISIAFNTLKKWLSSEASLSEAFTQSVETRAKVDNTISTDSNTVSKIRNALSNLEGLATTIRLTASIIFHTIITYINTDATLFDAYANVKDAETKGLNIGATYGLATAIGVLDAVLSPILLPILAIIGAIIALTVVMEKVGEAFGWWKDFGSMFEAIGDGLNRIWNAFMNSDIIQGIIQYFTDFFTVLQYVYQSIMDMFGALFGWSEDNGTFDIVQSIIDVFGTLGQVVSSVWNLLDDFSNSPLGFITWLNPLGIILFHLDEIGSFIEDISDAIDRFIETSEFQELATALGEVWTELQEPFQEIWSLITEIMDALGVMSQDPEGQGTEDRINFLVEIFKGLATVIRVVVIPILKAFATVIKVILFPLRVLLTVINAITSALSGASKGVDMFGMAWKVITAPITMVQNIISGIGDIIRFVTDSIRNFINYLIEVISSMKIVNDVINVFKQAWELLFGPVFKVYNIFASMVNMIKSVSNAIKNSIIGKLLGWDKDNKDNNDKNSQVKTVRNGLYDKVKDKVKLSDMNFITRNQILGELDKQKLTRDNVNNVHNLGKTYNHTNNQKQIVVNQNFSEGSMPIDARNMTKKEARKMFIGAFGYNRSVGSNGILR